MAAAHDTDEVLDLIVDEAARLLGTEYAFIRLLEGGVLVPSAGTGSVAGYLADSAESQPTLSVGIGASAMGHVMASKNPLVFDDLSEEELITPAGRLTQQKHGFKAGALIPLLANDRSIGVLVVFDKRIRRFTEDEVSLLMAFADQAALALEKAWLLNEAEREKERSDALYQISNLLAGAHETGEVLDLIVNEASRLLGTTGAFIRLLEDNVLVARAATESVAAFLADTAANQPALVVELGSSFMGHVMASKKPVTTENAQEFELTTPAGRLINQKHGFRGAVVVPLLANDRPLGVLSVMDSRIRHFTEDEVSLLTAFADQAALALEKARLLKEAETERERAETERERSNALYQVSNMLAGAHETQEVLELIVNEASRLVGAPYIIVRLMEGGPLVPRAATGPAAAYAAETIQNLQVVEGTSASGHAMATKEPVYGEDVIPPQTRQHLRNHGFYGTAAFPLLANNQPIGTLSVADYHVRTLTDDEASLLMAFADLASLALEKARLLNEAETERERSDALYRVSNLLAGAHDTDEVLNLIVNEAARLVGASAAFLRLVKNDVLVSGPATETAAVFQADSAQATPGFPTDKSLSSVGYVMATKEPLIMEDAATSEYISPEQRDVIAKNDFHGSVGVPLLANDQSIGVLFAIDHQIRRFTEDEVSLLTAFADQASLALEKARLLNEAETERERSDALYRVSNLLAGAHDTDEVLDLIVNESVRLLGAHAAFIRLMEGNELVSSVATESGAAFLAEIATRFPTLPLHTDESPIGHVMATKEPLILEEMADGEWVGPELASLTRKHDFHGAAYIPLLANDRSIGVLILVDNRPRRFTDEEVSLLTAFADQASLAIEKARLLNEAETKEHETLQLYEVTTLLASNHDMDSVLDLIPKTAAELLNCDAVMITRYDEAQNRLVVARQHNFPPEMLQSLVIRPGDGCTGRAFQERRPVWTTDARSDPSWKFAEESTDNEARNAVLVLSHVWNQRDRGGAVWFGRHGC